MTYTWIYASMSIHPQAQWHIHQYSPWFLVNVDVCDEMIVDSSELSSFTDPVLPALLSTAVLNTGECSWEVSDLDLLGWKHGKNSNNKKVINNLQFWCVVQSKGIFSIFNAD